MVSDMSMDFLSDILDFVIFTGLDVIGAAGVFPE